MAVFKKITLLSSFALIALSTTALCAGTNFYRARPVSKNATMGFRTRYKLTLYMPKLATKDAAKKRFLARRKVAKFTSAPRKQEFFRARPATTSTAVPTKTRAKFAYLMKAPAKVRFNQLKSLQLVAEEMPAGNTAGAESATE